tara:strand:+ start:457 stop:1329 length:873 start_codon:yes stop_codon:yes gene_type:complete
MAKLGVTPTHKKVADIKGTILSPSLTPYFEVQFPVPAFMMDLNAGTTSPYNYLTLLCTEASLPGNSLATFNVDNDYTGVSEKMPHRKVYDQDLKLTFYVNAEKNSYYPIRFFESYISYIAGEDPSDSESLERLRGQNYYYRMSYPDDYMIDGLFIKKFEKGGRLTIPEDPPKNQVNRQLQYEFIRTYPTAINSMPVAYGNVDVLKCTVSYSYIRYVQHNTFSTKRKAADPINILPSLEPAVEENPKPRVYTPYEQIKDEEREANKIKDPLKGSWTDSGLLKSMTPLGFLR